MINEKTRQLINKELDGALSGREKIRLQAVYARDAAAREYRDSLLQMSRLVAKVEAEPAPAHLKHYVMNAIRARKVRTKVRHSVFQQIVAVSKIVDRKIAIAFALGCLVSLFFFAIYQGGWENSMSGETQDLVGTLFLRDTVNARQTFAIAAGSGTGNVRTVANGRNVVAEISIVTGSSFGFRMVFSPAVLTLTEVRPTQDTAASLEFSTGLVKLNATGNAAFSVILARKSAAATSLNFNITVDGAQQQEKIVIAAVR